MLQDGPFSVGDFPPLPHPFSTETKAWVRMLGKDPLLMTKYRAVRNQIFDFLGITSFDETLILLHNKELKAKAAQRAHLLLGNMFGISGSHREINATCMNMPVQPMMLLTPCATRCWLPIVLILKPPMK